MLVDYCAYAGRQENNIVFLSNKDVGDGFWENVLPDSVNVYSFDVKHTVGRVNSKGNKVLAKEILVKFS